MVPFLEKRTSNISGNLIMALRVLLPFNRGKLMEWVPLTAIDVDGRLKHNPTVWSEATNLLLSRTVEFINGLASLCEKYATIICLLFFYLLFSCVGVWHIYCMDSSSSSSLKKVTTYIGCEITECKLEPLNYDQQRTFFYKGCFYKKSFLMLIFDVDLLKIL